MTEWQRPACSCRNPRRWARPGQMQGPAQTFSVMTRVLNVCRLTSLGNAVMIYPYSMAAADLQCRLHYHSEHNGPLNQAILIWGCSECALTRSTTRSSAVGRICYLLLMSRRGFRGPLLRRQRVDGDSRFSQHPLCNLEKVAHRWLTITRGRCCAGSRSMEAAASFRLLCRA